VEFTFQILLANDIQFRRNMMDLSFVDNTEYKFKRTDIVNYNCAYYGQIKAKSFRDVPDKLFEMFNINHPKDYLGRSLSVGDIVIVNGMMFICCGIGFKEIEFDLVQ